MKATRPASPFAILKVRRFIAFRVCFNARFYYPVFAVFERSFVYLPGYFLIMFAVLMVFARRQLNHRPS